MKRRTTRRVALALRDRILEHVPDTAEFEVYRKSLRVDDVRGFDGLVVALYAEDPEVDLEDLEAESFLIWLSGRPKTPLDKRLMLLSPWPVELVPDVPGRKRARKVSPVEVNVHRERLVEVARTDRAVEGALRSGHGRAAVDLAFFARRLERGGPGVPRVPHIRKSLRETKRLVERIVREESRVLRDPVEEHEDRFPAETVDDKVLEVTREFQDVFSE